MNESVVYYSLLILIICAFAYGVYVIVQSRSKRNAVWYLGWFMVIVAIENLQLWFIYVKPEALYPDVVLYFIPFEMLATPLFFLFVVYYLGKSEKYKKWKVLIYGPFVLFLIVYLYIKGVVFSGASHPETVQKDFYWFFKLEELVALLLALFIGFLCFKVIRIFQKENARFSYDKVIAPTRWIKQILGLAIGLTILWAFTLLFDLVSVYRIGNYAYLPAWYGFTLLIIWIGYSGFFQSKVLKERKEIQRLYSTKAPIGVLTASENAIDMDKQDSTEVHFDRILELLSKDRLYLDPNLNLQKLSKHVEISTSYLSKIVRKHSESHFSDFINSYRVNAAEEMLVSSEFADYNILSIALEAGFNSKTTFYQAFKKQKGLTPTQFRKEHSSI